MIVLSIADSLLSWFSPVDCVFCYLPSIKCIWSKAIVVLIYNDYTQRISLGVIVDLEQYCDVFPICLCLSIVSFSVKASNHHSLISREILGFGFFDKVWEWYPRFPLSCRCKSPIRDSLRESDTLTTIPYLRELREKHISRIPHRSWIRRVCNHVDILTIYSNSWHRWIVTWEDLPFWHNSFLPEPLRDTSIIPWKRECEWRLDEVHILD